MLSKELFCKLLNWAIKQEEKADKLNDALQEYSGDKDFTGFFTHDTSVIVEWLENAMGDTEETISWWVWDTDCGKAEDELCTISFPKEKKDYTIKTPEDLYDYLFNEFPLPGIQEQLLVSAQSEGVKFALRKLAESRENCSSDDYKALIKLLLNKIHDDYMIEIGVDPIMDMESCTVERPTLFRRK